MKIGEVTFKEIVKLVHPDINPGIEDPSGKMSQIMLYRNEPATLYRLSVDWGLIHVDNGKIITGYNKKHTSRIKYRRKRRHKSSNIEVGSRILVKTKGIVATVIRITPKRYYFSVNGKVSFCLKKNALNVN